MFQHTLHWCVGCQTRQSHQAQPVILSNAVVVRSIDKRQRQQPLLLEIALVNAREAACDHRRATQQPWR